MLLILLTVMALSASGAFVVSRYAATMGLIDIPSGRSSHKRPTPKGGGIGIAMSLVFASCALGLSWIIWAPVALLSCMSLVGDRSHLSASFRLIIHLSVASICCWEILKPAFEIGGSFSEAAFESVLFGCAVVYVAGTGNFFNFMDGINGIAALTGAIGFAVLGWFASQQGEWQYVELCILVSVSCLSFLPFNFPKARVFMGDVGSVLLGFVFGIVCLSLSQSCLDFVCMAAMIFPFYADELTSMVIRIRDGESLTAPHRRHLYQIMANQLQMAHWQVVLVFVMFQLAVCLSVILLRPLGMTAVLGFLSAVFLLFSVTSTWFHRKYE